MAPLYVLMGGTAPACCKPWTDQGRVYAHPWLLCPFSLCIGLLQLQTDAAPLYARGVHSC